MELLRTERLLLRIWRDDDAAPFQHWTRTRASRHSCPGR